MAGLLNGDSKEVGRRCSEWTAKLALALALRSQRSNCARLSAVLRNTPLDSRYLHKLYALHHTDWFQC